MLCCLLNGAISWCLVVDSVAFRGFFGAKYKGVALDLAHEVVRISQVE